MRAITALTGGLLTAAAILVIGWQIHRNQRQPRPHAAPPTVIVAPPGTPLPRRVREKRNPAARSPDSTSRPAVRAQRRQPTGTAPARPRARRRAARKRRTTGRAPSTPPAAQQPPQAAQPGQNAPEPRPPVDVQIPGPVTVCVRGVGGIDCP